MNRARIAPLTIMLQVLWFTWAGTVLGWGSPAILAITGAIALLWLVWLIRPGTRTWWSARPSLIELALWGFLTSAFLSAAVTVAGDYTMFRLAVLGGYLIAFYVVRTGYTAQQVSRGVVWAGWVLLILAMGEGYFFLLRGELPTSHLFGGQNQLAGLLVCILPVGWAVLSDRTRLYWTALGVLALLFTKSMGGLAALVVAVTVLVWPRLSRRLQVLVVAGLLLADVGVLAWHTDNGRVANAQIAVRNVLERPLLGSGPGTWIVTTPPEIDWWWFSDRVWRGYNQVLQIANDMTCYPESQRFWCYLGHWHYHAHSLPFTVASELGLVGLLALAGLVYATWRLRGHAPRWAWAVVAGMGVYSLVDELIWFWGPGVLVMAYLALLARGEDQDDGVAAHPGTGRVPVGALPAHRVGTRRAGIRMGRIKWSTPARGNSAWASFVCGPYWAWPRF